MVELGLELEGQTTVEGPSVGSLIGLADVRTTLAMLRTPDGQGIELDKFHTPNAVRFGPVDAPVNALASRSEARLGPKSVILDGLSVPASAGRPTRA